MNTSTATGRSLYNIWRLSEWGAVPHGVARAGRCSLLQFVYTLYCFVLSYTMLDYRLSSFVFNMIMLSSSLVEACYQNPPRPPAYGQGMPAHRFR